MEDEAKKLKKLIESSGRILITSHISPDPDAVSSLLLLGATLKLNYPNKSLKMVLEEEPEGLDFLEGYKDIQFQPIDEALIDFKPDLFILLDGNNYMRVSRHHGQRLRELINSNDIRTIFIDHHELDGKDQSDVFINQDSPATTQDVYELCFKYLNFAKPQDYAQTAMTGLYADSGGFVYTKSGSQEKTFDLAKELIVAGAEVERVKNLLNQYSEADMKVLGVLGANVSHEDGYTYTYLSDDFINEWLQKNTYPQLDHSIDAFKNEFIRNIGGRKWGFIVYKNALQGKDIYSVSFRSVSGVKDVASIAAKLGGGGHKPAAAARFPAGSIEEAIDKIKRVITESG